MKQLLTPRQVARAIGVSESSLKRWCDRGLIPTVRTAGGHRRLPISGVLEFIRQTRRELACADILGLPSTTGKGGWVIDRASEQLLAALIAGDDARARQVVFDLYLAGHSPSVIGDRVIAPAFAEIGNRWGCGDVSIYQERRACEICEDALREFAEGLPPAAPEAALALGGAPAGDPYRLPTRLVELVLRAAGWRASSFGVNLPLETLADAVRDSRPRLLWLSLSHLDDRAGLLHGFATLARTATETGTVLALGGRAIDEQLHAQLGQGQYCENLAALQAFAETMRV